MYSKRDLTVKQSFKSFVSRATSRYSAVALMFVAMFVAQSFGADYDPTADVTAGVDKIKALGAVIATALIGISLFWGITHQSKKGVSKIGGA